ncbi:MAG: prolipoprotein diacylglyceryl transferase [Bacilli bacterium]|nr:prolipoprotein diacylglyceryl transferase [Bacilli bacterium]
MKSTIIDFGWLEIKWYSLFLLIAFTSASIVFYLEAKKKGLEKDQIIDLLFYGLLIGILGARIYYILFNLKYYLEDPIEMFCIWHGGLAIHGGIIATFLYLIIRTKKKKENIILLLDMIAVGLLLGQAIGRWGNFFNQEAFGRIVSKEFLMNLPLPNFIIQGMYINGSYREPTFLYESICSIIGFGIILLLRRIKKIKTGNLTSFYLIWYGFTRFIIESFRSDSLMFMDIKVAQLVSILGIIIGIILFIKSKNYQYYQKDTIIQEK